MSTRLTDGVPAPVPVARPVGRPSRPPFRRRHAFVLRSIGWGALLGLGWVVVSIALHATTVVRVTVLAQSLVPIIFLPVWIVAVSALWRRDWLFAGACIALVAAQVVLVVRRPRPDVYSSDPRALLRQTV